MSRTVSFQPLLFGGDINVYSVARAFHEAYGVKSVAFGKFHTFPCAFSSIIDYRTCPDNEDPAVFLSNVEKVALEFSHKTVIVLGCGDSYVQLCAHLKDQFPRNVVAPYIDGALLDRLINKDVAGSQASHQGKLQNITRQLRRSHLAETGLSFLQHLHGDMRT